ncbi:MAG: DUF371 domain-containing protein [Candidatus Bathyarchaeota archaeon]|nr:DUF371 domain-containing protein [Candidatus Bathyarchaeota archaeon]
MSKTTQLTEIIVGYGHPNVSAMHKTTVEFTKDKHLSKNGDCILIVNADKVLTDLNPLFKEKLRQPNSKLIVTIEADGLKDQIIGEGSPDLSLKHPTDIVIRKSAYISDRTLAIHANKAAQDLSRQLIKKLQNPQQKATITLTVEV